MRIAQVAPLLESVPPQGYGGTERVVYNLTEELIHLGHEVTLFASGDSTTSARLESVVPHSLRTTLHYKESLPYHLLQLQRVADMSSQFDVIHFHIDYLHFPISRFLKTPSLTTLHGRLDFPVLKHIYTEYTDQAVVSISLHQQTPLGNLPHWAGNVYHGLPAHFGSTPDKPRDYLAFLGRISPEKRVDRAIEIAERVNLPLKIAAKLDPAEKLYYEGEIRTLMEKPHVEYVGEIGEHEKESFLKGAHALLFPIDWPEPFGLVIIEAMACGTPVIAFNRGSVSELIENGKTGFVVESVDEAVGALSKLHLFNPVTIRKEFLKRFSVNRMTRDYLQIYKNLMKPLYSHSHKSNQLGSSHPI